MIHGKVKFFSFTFTEINIRSREGTIAKGIIVAAEEIFAEFIFLFEAMISRNFPVTAYSQKQFPKIFRSGIKTGIFC